MSDLDALTGLLTRRAFDEELKKALEHARATETPVTLAMMDIDKFKVLNDHYGHATGDAIIQSVAGAVRGVAKGEAVAGRYGGEEFAILFPNGEREATLLVAERLRAEVERPRTFPHAGKKVELSFTISCGIAAFPLDARSDGELVRKADQALYRAKATGRNKICLAQEERLVTKTTHYPQTQLERLAKLAQKEGLGEAALLREALDDLLIKYGMPEAKS
jgi:diguanylate cyclase (GGDEF)-like protein